MTTNEEILIGFVSTPENYEKEKSGAKPNTVRTVEEGDVRYPFLLNKKATHIQIIRKNSHPMEKFKRKITDITFWDGRFIISWDNEQYAKGQADALDNVIPSLKAVLRSKGANNTSDEMIDAHYPLLRAAIKKAGDLK